MNEQSMSKGDEILTRIVVSVLVVGLGVVFVTIELLVAVAPDGISKTVLWIATGIPMVFWIMFPVSAWVAVVRDYRGDMLDVAIIFTVISGACLPGFYFPILGIVCRWANVALAGVMFWAFLCMVREEWQKPLPPA